MLAKKVNTKKTTISNYETGYSTPSHEMLTDLADVLNKSVDWLLGRNYDKSIDDDSFRELPILGQIRAGQPIDRIEHYEGTYPVLKRTINGYDAFWLKVKGESMSGDEIHDGDLVCVIVTTDVQPSEIAAVAVNGEEATLKRVKFLDGQCILTPSNRNMEPMIYPAEKIHIIGKIVGFQRYYK